MVQKNDLITEVLWRTSAPRDGRYIEKVGTFDSMLAKDNADRIKLVEERIKYYR